MKDFSMNQMLSPEIIKKAPSLFQEQKKGPSMQSLGVKNPVTADVIIEGNQNPESLNPIKINNYVSHRVFSKKDVPVELNNALLLKNNSAAALPKL